MTKNAKETKIIEHNVPDKKRRLEIYANIQRTIELFYSKKGE